MDGPTNSGYPRSRPPRRRDLGFHQIPIEIDPLRPDADAVLAPQLLPDQPIHQRHQMLARPRQHKRRGRRIPVQLEAG